jgi:hypothetical protein
MRKVPIFLAVIGLATAGAPPVSVPARAELIPGGWLQPPRVLQPPPPSEATTPEPAAVQPAPPPPRPKVTRPAAQQRPPPVRTPPSDGKVQF